ncbi:hypothetical protein M422DRAFT_33836 [Sphaerobolus stellatus SS14]|uniref:Signal recognition particle subunit SRP19 n=1 Tax=Sphaerobolus stellatus (strain SS14) TaxID=990650 RepID=A0A0C9U371_SPHS4|nr:hypothetical protein M422DRAFT_33836 [Sphaerobolus stellatus SS14]
MSRNARIEEVSDDEFDDDTDLPLPLPNTGIRGPLIQEWNDPQQSSAGSAPSPSRPQFNTPSQAETSASGEQVTVDPVTGKKTIWIQDSSAYKLWTSVYPIYLDAKRPYSRSERRIPREKSIWWPLSSDIVDACGYLGLKTLHEPQKQHPRDWENPGRVKVCFKLDGRLQNPRIKSKKQLLEDISAYIQRMHPDLVPKAGTETSEVGTTSAAAQVAAQPEVKPSPTKKDKAKTTGLPRTAPAPIRNTKSRLPQPPPGSTRVSTYSPAQEANILIETVKAGMTTPAPGESAAAPAVPGGKGKRKVIRVRA